MLVQRIGDALHYEPRHALVDVSGELDEAGIEPVHLRLPREIERIDGDAVASEPWPRVKGHEAERLRLRRLDDLPDVDLERTAHERDLVDQADVDAPEGVLEQLHH